MSKNRLTTWIDRTNYKTCLKLNEIYYAKLQNKTYRNSQNITFILLVLVRVFLVFCNLFRGNLIFTSRNLNKIPLKSIPSNLKIFIYGLNYFIKPKFETEFYENKIPLKNLSFEKQSNSVKVSIIIIADNSVANTLNCLRSIKLNTTHTDLSIEVLVLAQDQEIEVIVKKIKGVTFYLRDDLSFAKACNKVIPLANGEYVCFLNNDTLVLENWLETLFSPFNQDNKTGIVCPKIIYGNGLLYESSGLFINNKSVESELSFKDPLASTYNYRREVDYCSNINLLLKKEDFLSIAGFDENFFNENDAIIDLCFTYKHLLSKKIYYQPHCNIVYYGNRNDSTQLGNAKININKWETELLKLNAQQPKDVLIFIDSYLPRFDKESGSQRALRLIEIFIDLGYHVIFVPKDGKPEAPYYEILTDLGVETIINYLGKSNFKKDIITVSSKAKIAWVCRPRINQKFSYIKKYNKAIKWIYDTVDLHFVRMEREAVLHDNKRKMAKSNRYKKIELSLAQKANVTVCITDVERSVLIKNNINNTAVIPNIHVLNNINIQAFESRDGILFIGSYEHKPNIDAVVWLVNEIMPLVWNKYPDVKLTLLGAKPTDEVLKLASDNVIIPGFIPDVSPYFNKSKLFVAPLRYGAGMKGKIGQSLEYGLPIVSTNIGTEGMGLRNEFHVLEANEPDAFAEQIIKLYTSKELWTKLSKNSTDSIKNYTPEVVRKQIKEIFSTFTI